MPTTAERSDEKQKPLVSDKETEARIAIYQWQEAKERLGEVTRRLSTATTVNFNCKDCAEQLVDEYEDAKDDFERAEKALLAGKPAGGLKKEIREQLEEKVQADARRGQLNALMADMTEPEARQKLQDLERERNRLESEEAARNLDRAGAPGMPAQPGEPVQRAPADISRKTSLEEETKKPTPNIPPRVGQGKEPASTAGGGAKDEAKGDARRGKPESSGQDSGPNAPGSATGSAAKIADKIEAIRRPGTADPRSKVDPSPAVGPDDTVGADSTSVQAGLKNP